MALQKEITVMASRKGCDFRERVIKKTESARRTSLSETEFELDKFAACQAGRFVIIQKRDCLTC